MKKDCHRNKKGETWLEAKSRYNRSYYQKNQKQLKAAQRARQRARRRAEVHRREQARKTRLESIQKGREARRKEQQEWSELGVVVARMNIQAGLSQKEIFRILQGLATRNQISKWIARGKKTVNLKRPTNSPRNNG